MDGSITVKLVCEAEHLHSLLLILPAKEPFHKGTAAKQMGCMFPGVRDRLERSHKNKI